jgi:CheY-like chemotaxis protein
MRVLIIDDDADQRFALALLLRALGHDVQAAADGPSGLATAVAFQPDVVLLDFHMPIMSGYETAAALRLAPTSRSVRLVLMTGSARATSDHAKGAGFDALVRKPASAAAILRAMGSRVAQGAKA